jgi:F0F1-type ATP synthase assembly protein I
VVERCPDKTEALGSIPSTRTMGEDNTKKISKWMIGIALFTKVSAWIVGPIIVALFLGKYLDTKYSTEPWIFITLFVVSFIISMTMITKISLNYIKKVDIK